MSSGGYCGPGRPRLIIQSQAVPHPSSLASDIAKMVIHLIFEIECRTMRKVLQYKIRKACAHERIGYSFNLANPSTRTSHYNSSGGGIEELVAIGRIPTPTTVPTANGLILVDNGAEEYTLQVKKLIYEFLYDGNYDRRATNSGTRDYGISPGYIIYMTYTLVSSSVSLSPETTSLQCMFQLREYNVLMLCCTEKEIYSATGFESKMQCFWCLCVFWLVFCELQVVAGRNFARAC